MLEPKQERSEWTQTVLLDAFAELLKTSGVHEVSVADVAARAGLTTGAVYARFGDKRGMVLALHRRLTEQAVVRMISWARKRPGAGASPRDVVRAWVRGASAYSRRREPVVRLGLALDDPDIAVQARTTLDASVESLSSMLRAASAELSGPEFEKGLALGVWAAQAMSVERLFMPAGELFAFDDDVVVEWLTELICHSAGITETHPKSTMKGITGGTARNR
jgi:AcrR family transcriptional regulator